MRLKQIETAFKDRKKPDKYTSGTMSADEAIEVLAIAGKDWRELSGDILEDNFEVLNWLTPEAFCYYLAGVLYVSVKENSPNLLVVDSIINMLDRSPDPAYWNDLFSQRWLLLNPTEVDVLSDWILWLADSKMHDDISLSRCLDCLESIKHRTES